MKSKLAKHQLRSFGLVMAGALAIIALAPAVFQRHPPRLWALALAGAMLLTALTFPNLLRPVHRGWMALGECLGWVNTRIILMVVYLILIVPIGLILRIRGKDPMLRRFATADTTYRVRRTKRPRSHMQHQY